MIEFLRVVLVYGLVVLAAGIATAAPSSDEAPPKIPVKTLGGLQFWSDTYIHAGWRIQTNLISGHFRLLDPDNVRHSWGSF